MTHPQIDRYDPTAMEASVARLFRELEQRKVRYAMLRNYECLPELRRDTHADQPTDIDLVVDSRDMRIWREAVTEVAEQGGWDTLVECDHWTQSQVRHHHIEAFHFYRLSPPQFLQIDLFHSYLVCGLPLVDEREMLEGRIYDADRNLTRIDPLKENLHRLSLLYTVLCDNPKAVKVSRDGEKLVRFWKSEQERFGRVVRAHFSVLGVQAIQALEQGDLPRFLRKMRWARVYFLMKFALSHPLRTPWYGLCRTRENRLRFLTRQCGRVVRVYAPKGEHRRLLREVMDDLARNNFVDEWKERAAGSWKLGPDERAVMEQGGLVIQWSDREKAHIDVASNCSAEALRARVVRVLVERHEILSVRPAAAATA